MHGEWKAGETAGGCCNYKDTCWMNPHYVLKPSAPTTVFISLVQKEVGDREFAAIAPMVSAFV